MVKRDLLKQKLRAAERRRQRRQGESPPSANSSPSAHASATEVKKALDSPSPDVMGMVVQTILQHSSEEAADPRDAVVVAAMRSCLRATTPNGQDAKSLAEKLNAISTRPGVSMRAFRDALQQLLAVASANHDPRRADAFLGYLAVLAEQ